MSLRRSLLSLLLVFVLSLGLFSTSFFAVQTANADSLVTIVKATAEGYTKNEYYDLRVRKIVRDKETKEYISGSTLYDASLHDEPSSIYNKVFNCKDYYYFDYLFCDLYEFSKSSNGEVIVNKGEGIQFNMNNIYSRATLSNSTSSVIGTLDITKIDSVIVKMVAWDGSVSYTDNYTITQNDNGYNFSFIADSVPADIVKFEIEVRYIAPYAYGVTSYDKYENKQCSAGFIGWYSVEFFEYPEETGILKGLSSVVSNIKEGISNLTTKLTSGFTNVVNKLTSVVSELTDGFSNVVSKLTSGFKDVVTNLSNLPSKLWKLIEDGLKALFVPTTEDITEVKENWDELLSDRFGGLYQSIHLIDDYAATFTESDEQTFITFPEFSIELAGSQFVFGGNEVDIVPDKFGFLVDVIKLMISIIATCLFVNGLRSRFTREVLEGGSEI